MTAVGPTRIPDSPLSRWDARWKLAALGVAALTTAALRHVGPVAAALALGLLLLAAARLPYRWVRDRLGLLGLTALPFPILLPFTLGPDGSGWDLGPLHASGHGLFVGSAVFLRCLAIGSFALVVVGTGEAQQTLAAAQALRVPGRLVLVTGLAYHYALELGRELRRVRLALRSRGFRMQAGVHGYRTVGRVVGAVLVRGSDRAERVTQAMLCRGFDGRFPTTIAFRTTTGDVVSAGALMAVSVTLLLWDLRMTAG